MTGSSRYRGGAIVAACVAATLAIADEPILFVDDREIFTVLALDEIFLRNRGGQDLDFHISRGGGRWERYRIPADKAALVDARGAAIAIATAPRHGDGVVATPPGLAPGDVTEPRVGAAGLYYYAVFEGSERVDLCWSSAADRWVAQRPHDGLCP